LIRQQLRGRFDLQCIVIALECGQHSSVERLNAQTHAIDAVRRQDLDLVAAESRGIRLDTEFIARSEVEPAAEKSEQPLQVAAGQMRRSSATDEESGDRPWDLEGLQFDLQGPEVVADEMVLSRHQCEIAITAAVGTERDVNISSRGNVTVVCHDLILACPHYCSYCNCAGIEAATGGIRNSGECRRHSFQYSDNLH